MTGPSGREHIWAAGVAQAQRGIDVTTDTVFRIASMTKIVTTIAVILLSERGEVDLDAPMADYLPDYHQPEVLDHFDFRTGAFSTRPAQHRVTIRQLLTHTSGYGYWFLDRRIKALTSGAPELYNPPFLISDPGTKFNYGISTDVVGQIIEPLSGQKLDEFFRGQIFEPLGMMATSFERPRDPDRLSSVFVRRRSGFDEKPIEDTGPAPRGGGGLYSTTRDYLRLLRMLLNGGRHDGQQFLAPSSVAEIGRNQIGERIARVPTTAFLARSNDFIFMDGSQKFGLGVTIETTDQPTGRSAGAYGWAGILNTYFWVDPVRQIAATIMMQVQPFADPLCVDVYRQFETAIYAALDGA